MTERELSCEGFLLCASMKEIRYEKLVSIDGKYEHIQKNCWRYLNILLFNPFHSYFLKVLFLLN